MALRQEDEMNLYSLSPSRGWLEPDDPILCPCGDPADETNEYNGVCYCEACVEGEAGVFRCVKCHQLADADALEELRDDEGERMCEACHNKMTFTTYSHVEEE
jgi:predicted CXXCH cytochrome family protein